jgi:hypothetical protein
MKCRIFWICLLILLFSINSFSQRKPLPLWLNQIEEAIQRDFTDSKISVQELSNNSPNVFKFTLYVRLTGGQQASINIEKGFGKNPEENFKSNVELINKTFKTPSNVLQNFGDEACIWNDIKGTSAIFIRKDAIFVSVVINQIQGKKTSEISFEDWAKRLAQSPDTYLPGN